MQNHSNLNALHNDNRSRRKENLSPEWQSILDAAIQCPALPQSRQFLDGNIHRNQLALRLRGLVIAIPNVHSARLLLLSADL